jgi:hypothetical protein
MYMLLLRNRDFNYVGTCLATNGWAIIRTRSIFIMELMVWSSQMRDQNVLIPSIGGSKCCAGHFWSHDLVDLMVRSTSFGYQNDAKATTAGSESFDPQHWGINVSRRPLLIPWSCGTKSLILTNRGSKWREGHSCEIRMFWSPALGDQRVTQATFDPMILWIQGFGPHNSRVKIDAKATAAGLDCYDPQQTGIKVSRRPLLIP